MHVPQHTCSQRKICRSRFTELCGERLTSLSHLSVCRFKALAAVSVIKAVSAIVWLLGQSRLYMRQGLVSGWWRSSGLEGTWDLPHQLTVLILQCWNRTVTGQSRSSACLSCCCPSVPFSCHQVSLLTANILVSKATYTSQCLAHRIHNICYYDCSPPLFLFKTRRSHVAQAGLKLIVC